MSAEEPVHQFSESDLEPSEEERSQARRGHVDRAAAAIAALSAGVLVGGLVALGACAAPFVFRLTPSPFAGDAMGAAFARFDQIALGATVLVLGCEVARTWASRSAARRPWPRVRRGASIVLAGCAAYLGLMLTPHINDLHRAGVRRGVGDRGAELERVHHQAELVSKVEVAVGIAVALLHVLTLSARRPEEEDDEEVLAPLPPGPRD